MIKRFFFLFSALVFLIGSTSVNLASNGLPTHTQLTPELKPTFLNNSYQVASVCFLGDGCGGGDFGKGDEPYEIDTVNQCKNEGYTITSCTLPSYPDVSCPYNDKYYAKCTPDNPRACKESGYSVFTCATGEVVDTSCPYDNNYKKCKCNPCSGYDYTYAQATVTGYVTDGSCQSCGETKYKRKPNPCSGYTSCECGGASGASVCYSGSVQKFNSCKPCCSSSCSGSTSKAGMAYYNSCYNNCTGQTFYTERSCDSSCAGSGHVQCSSGYYEASYTDECGNACYYCACSTSYCVTSCKEEGSYAILETKKSYCGGDWYDSGKHSIPKWYGGYCANLEGGRCMYDGTYWCKC